MHLSWSSCCCWSESAECLMHRARIDEVMASHCAGEGWRQPMNDCKLTQPHCTPHPPDGQPSDCGFQASPCQG